MVMKKFIKTKDVAKMLGLSVHTVLGMVKRGVLPCFRFSPITMRFDEAEIHAFIKNAKKDQLPSQGG